MKESEIQDVCNQVNAYIKSLGLYSEYAGNWAGASGATGDFSKSWYIDHFKADVDSSAVSEAEFAGTTVYFRCGYYEKNGDFYFYIAQTLNP